MAIILGENIFCWQSFSSNLKEAASLIEGAMVFGYYVQDPRAFGEAVQTTQGTFIACLEEIAYRKGWISKEKVRELAQPLMKTEYGKYLINIIEEM